MSGSSASTISPVTSETPGRSLRGSRARSRARRRRRTARAAAGPRGRRARHPRRLRRARARAPRPLRRPRRTRRARPCPCRPARRRAARWCRRHRCACRRVRSMSSGVYDRACRRAPVPGRRPIRCDVGLPLPTMAAVPDPSDAMSPPEPPGPGAPPRHPSLARRSCAPRARSNGPRTCSCSPRPAAAGVLDQGDVLVETSSRSSPSASRRAAPTSSTTPPTPEADRLHPTKRYRPVAAGELSRATGPWHRRRCSSSRRCAIAAPINDGKLTALIAAYLAVTIAYSLWLKHEPVIDLAAVAAGFVFRAIAGGVATGVPISDWFLIVAGAGSLFMVTGQAPRRAGRARRRVARSPQHARRLLRRVPALRPRGRVGRDAHRVLPLGVRERVGDRRHHVVPALDRAVRARGPPLRARRSSRAAAARPRRSCSATACSRCSACSGSSRSLLGVHG